MLSKLENGKGVNLEHALPRVLGGLGLTRLVFPKAHAPWLDEALRPMRPRPASWQGGISQHDAIRRAFSACSAANAP
ncbi:hypothetical protein D9M68_530000 [compost metagenome]